MLFSIKHLYSYIHKWKNWLFQYSQVNLFFFFKSLSGKSNIFVLKRWKIIQTPFVQFMVAKNCSHLKITKQWNKMHQKTFKLKIINGIVKLGSRSGSNKKIWSGFGCSCTQLRSYFFTYLLVFLFFSILHTIFYSFYYLVLFLLFLSIFIFMNSQTCVVWCNLWNFSFT